MDAVVYKVYWEGMNRNILSTLKTLERENKRLTHELARKGNGETLSSETLKRHHNQERARLSDQRFRNEMRIRLLKGRFTKPVCYYCGHGILPDYMTHLRISMTATIPTYTCIAVPTHPHCKLEHLTDSPSPSMEPTYCDVFREEILPLIKLEDIQLQNLAR